MTTAAASITTRLAGVALPRRLIDVGATLGALWLIFGVYLDGWAHNTQLPDSFWTPWHGVLYSGYGVLAAFLVLVVARGIAVGGSLGEAIPDGYAPSVVGVVIFGIGGAFDMIWHTLFGIERNIDVLFSPSHLMLAIGIVLLVSGPLRSVWRRGITGPSTDALLALASMAMLLLILTFMFQFATPFANTPATPGEARSGELAQIRALFSVLSFTVFLIGLLLLGIRERVVLPGSVTALLVIDAVALLAMRASTQPIQRDVIVSAAIVGGVTGDALLWRLRPSPSRVRQVRVFAAALPLVLFWWYFGAIAVHIGTWYTPHALTGMGVLAGLAGLLVSYLIFPRTEPVPPR